MHPYTQILCFKGSWSIPSCVTEQGHVRPGQSSWALLPILCICSFSSSVQDICTGRMVKDLVHSELPSLKNFDAPGAVAACTTRWPWQIQLSMMCLWVHSISERAILSLFCV